MPTRRSVAGIILLALATGACGANGTGGIGNTGGTSGMVYDFAGSYTGVLTQGTAACEFGTQPGSASNAVLVLTMPSSMEVDVASIDWCTVRGTPAGDMVSIQPYVCPTVTGAGGDYSVTTLLGDQLFMWSDGKTLEVHLRFSTQYFSQYIAGQNTCSYSLGGIFTKQ